MKQTWLSLMRLVFYNFVSKYFVFDIPSVFHVTMSAVTWTFWLMREENILLFTYKLLSFSPENKHT